MVVLNIPFTCSTATSFTVTLGGEPVPLTVPITLTEFSVVEYPLGGEVMVILGATLSM